MTWLDIVIPLLAMWCGYQIGQAIRCYQERLR